jgi:hypothetical protein
MNLNNSILEEVESVLHIIISLVFMRETVAFVVDHIRSMTDFLALIVKIVLKKQYLFAITIYLKPIPMQISCLSLEMRKLTLFRFSRGSVINTKPLLVKGELFDVCLATLPN